MDAAGIRAICARYGDDPQRLLDMARAVQARDGWISPQALEVLAEATGLTRIKVEGTVSFYSFFSLTPKAPLVIRLCDDIIDRFAGFDAVRVAFETALGLKVGESDAAIALELTPCIGLCDHAPAAMIGPHVLGRLTPARARKIAEGLRSGRPVADVLGLAGSALDQARAQAPSLIRVAGPLLQGASGLDRARGMTPAQILDEIEASGLRGCGGAGFPTARKWRTAAATPGPRHILCNADEGEPGTFKDRVLLTERPDLVFDGIEIAARAVGAEHALLYLRGEYEYLLPHLTEALGARPIRIQLGAGAYVCGEEGALISSAEGLPGEPKTRPPFPVVKGYRGQPTVVNNVETLAHVAQILGTPGAFQAEGHGQSRGTRLFSVAGDCARPGIYELPWGVTLGDLLAQAGADHAAAVQVGGPSGSLVGRDGFARRLAYEDLSTGGAITIFGPDRNLMEVILHHLAFFAHESCGYCTPCRVGTVMMLKAVERVARGHASPDDWAEIRDLAATMQETSRCGLGVSAPNPVLTSMENFPLVWSALTRPAEPGVKASFDIQGAIARARGLAHRRSMIFDRDFS